MNELAWFGGWWCGEHALGPASPYVTGWNIPHSYHPRMLKPGYLGAERYAQEFVVREMGDNKHRYNLRLVRRVWKTWPTVDSNVAGEGENKCGNVRPLAPKDVFDAFEVRRP
jgi:hypothetical protein